MKSEKKNDLLNEIIKIGNENILDLDLNSTKFGDIMNNLDTRILIENQRKNHQRCITSISNEDFTNQMMKEINNNNNGDGELDEIYEILNEQDNDESANKSHSRHNSEAFDYLRFSNYTKNNNIKEFQIDDRKTVDIFDKLHVYENDDSDNEEEKIYNKENNDQCDLGAILGMQLEKFNKENDGIILNENSNNLIENLKNENNYKYIRTGTKIDFVEEIEGNIFNSKKNFKELEKYISKIDKKESHNLGNSGTSNNNQSIKIIYDMLSAKNDIKLFKELSSYKGMIYEFEKNNIIYCSTQKGNILIYNLDEEKKIKELDNPFKEESKNKTIFITAMSTDEKYIICGYSNGKIALFRKGREKLNKTKLYMIIKEIDSKKNITQIKVYSGKKDRIIFYLIYKNGIIFRVKIYKGMFKIKNKIKYKHISINSINYQYYNLEINPYSYKCFGICNYKGVFIYNIKKSENKLLFSKIQDIYNNFYPNFCFINSFNKEEKSKFMVSINPCSVFLYEINSNFTNTIQLNKYMFKDPIIKIGVFINELVYIFDKANQITLINYNSNTHKITQKCIHASDNINLSDKKNFQYKNIEELSLYENIICNTNRNIIINSKRKILLISPITLNECINKICDKNEKNKWPIFYYLINQIVKNKHPIWSKEDYEKCYNLIIEKINICLDEIIKKDLNEKIENLNNFLEFLFNIELYDYITSEKDSLYSKLNDDKIYFYILEPYIIQNKMKSIPLPISFFNKLIEFYVNQNKKSWLCELLIHFDIKLLCDKNLINKNGISLIDILDKNNLINIIIYLIFNNYEMNKEYSYYTPIVDILLNLIKESKNQEKNEILIKFNEIISNNNEYNEINENSVEIKKEEDINNKNCLKNNFIEENKYNDELLFSNYYLRIKLFWYIYRILFIKGVDDNNKKKAQELIDKSLEIIFNPKIYEILEINEGNSNNILNLDKEIIFLINKIFKDEFINEYCTINKEEILEKIEKLVKKKYISQIIYYIICLKAYLEDNTLEINKETKMNILFFFMNNDIEKNNEIKSEKFEQDLIELLKNIDSFSFNENDKIIKLSANCKNKFPKLYEYILNNFKK